MRYERCSTVDADVVYEAFKEGFSDYMIKFNMTPSEFDERFFGPEGNARQHSFVALDVDKPVGVVLGGIRSFEGHKTLRCGAMAVSPDYRGQGISRELMRLHQEEGLKKGCRQLWLEVIVGNDRAINFYCREGYEKAYDLSYFTLSAFDRLSLDSRIAPDIREIGFEAYEPAVSQLITTHLNWQNTLDYIQMLPGIKYYAAYVGGEIAGAIALSTGGKIFQLAVDPAFRNKGVATALLAAVVREIAPPKLTISFPNNHLLAGFLFRIGFIRDQISQYEMFWRHGSW